LRQETISRLGPLIDGIEFEEKLLYNMASNSEPFGKAMTRYNEKQLYKKILKVIEIPPLGRLDNSLMSDLRFHQNS
jgi:hypothetical protein